MGTADTATVDKGSPVAPYGKPVDPCRKEDTSQTVCSRILLAVDAGSKEFRMVFFPATVVRICVGLIRDFR